MEICPNCQTYMNFYITYNCGTPCPGYRCPCCHYDTNQIQIMWSATTPIVPKEYIVNCKSLESRV